MADGGVNDQINATDRRVEISTVDVTAVLPEEVQRMRMVVFHRLRHVDDIGVAVVVPADTAQVDHREQRFDESRGGRGRLQHVELAEVGVDESGLLEHPPHVLENLEVELASLGLRQRGVLQQWSRAGRWAQENAINMMDTPP